MRTFLLVLVLAVGMGLAALMNHPVLAANTDDQQVKRLISQLGSKQFKEREAATLSLDALGEALQRAMQDSELQRRNLAQHQLQQIVNALRQTSQTSDLEVRRRAECLATHLQKRVQTAQLLEPWRGRVVFQDTPLSEAVSKFAKQTKFPIELAPRHNRGNEAKITYDSGETSFWPAFDQFCQRVGLVENPTPAPVTEQTVRVLNGNAPLQGGVVISSTHTTPQSPFNGRLLLMEGKPTVVPTCYAGAVRMRALPQPGTRSAWGSGKGETLFMLEVTPQPKMAWLGVVDVHIDKAVDEQEQDLQPTLPGDSSYIAALGGNNVMVWEPNGSGALLDARQVPVRLRAGERPSKTLVEVKGRVAAQVQTPQQPVIIVEDVLKAVGRTYKGRDGESLKVIEVNQRTDGSIRLRVQIEDPSLYLFRTNNGFKRGNQAMLLKNGLLGPGSMVREALNPDVDLALLDGKANSIPVVDTSWDLVANGNTTAQDIRLTYRPLEERTEIGRFLYSGRRSVVVEIPFTLSNVPLAH